MPEPVKKRGIAVVLWGFRMSRGLRQRGNRMSLPTAALVRTIPRAFVSP